MKVYNRTGSFTLKLPNLQKLFEVSYFNNLLNIEVEVVSDVETTFIRFECADELL